MRLSHEDDYLGESRLNSKFIALALLFLMVCAALSQPLTTQAEGEPIVDIKELTSGSGANGDVILMRGTIVTQGGTFQLFLANILVASGKATGYTVETNFTIPALPNAQYELVLRDVRLNQNSTGPFDIVQGYLTSASPSAIQEGDSVTITVSSTGASPGSSNGAKIAIVSPTGETYTTEITLGTANAAGVVSKTLTFPSSDFTPVGETLLAGSYTIKINSTLGKGSFNVNILDASQYHRGETMQIKARGYEANQAATITILSKQETLNTIAVTADSSGNIKASWVVSPSFPIGEGTVRITATGNPKDMADKQTFTVIGYNVNISATNLAGSPVSGILVNCFDSATGINYNATSDVSGKVSFGLESGAHALTAYWNEVNIGTTDITVTGDGNFTLVCQLTDLKVTVKTEDGTAMPFVDLAITYQYQSSSATKTASTTGATGGNGYYLLSSTLTSAKYTIAASLYGHVFNQGNDTFSISNAKATTEISIICPSVNVSMGVTGYNDQAIQGARIQLVELSNGLFYSATTDASGLVTVHVTYGTYRLRVYKEDALIRETSLRVFDDTRRQIKCNLYGIDLTVSVVDFFGSPISNAKVTVNGQETVQANTESNGRVTFGNIVGGDMQIVAEIQNQPEAFQAIKVIVDQPGTVEVKLDKYVSVGGALMQANISITLLIILVAAIVFVVLEVVRRKKVKSSNGVSA
jgi:hypothetical protein